MSKEFFSSNGIKIFNEDILKLDSIKKNTIDLIVTSPPYNVDISYNGYHDNIPYKKYLEFTKRYLKKCFELAKKDGRFCLNLPLDKNKPKQTPVYADVMKIAQEVGWKYHSTIIWNEQNISRRTAWGSWKSASAPYVIAPVEVIVVLYKEKWKKNKKGKSDITGDEFKEWTNGVWTFPGESKKRIGHPAPFPVELPRRCIKLFSYVGDKILDPFLGSGSTLISCFKNNRKGIGVDIDKEYCKLSVKRLKEGGLNQKKIR